MRSFSNRGYTLIEIMMVLVISSVVVGGGIASYNRFSGRRVLTGAGEQLVAVLRETQKSAQSGEKPDSCVSGNLTLDGWRVEATAQEHSLRVGSVCDGNFEVEETITLPESTQFENGFQAQFDSITGGLVGPRLTINLRQAAQGGLGYEIVVETSGVVNAGRVE